MSAGCWQEDSWSLDPVSVLLALAFMFLLAEPNAFTMGKNGVCSWDLFDEKRRSKRF